MNIFKSGLIFATSVLLIACGGDGGGSSTPTPPPPPTGGGGGNTNGTPVSNAGADITQDISSSPINIDGSASSDPDNDALTYSWSVVNQPADSTFTLTDASDALARFQSFAPGDFTLELTVSDPSGASSTDQMTVTLVNQAPIASASTTGTSILIGDDYVLDASASTDPNEQTLTYNWEIVTFPPETNMSLNYSGVNPTIQFDVGGQFEIELTVSDGYEQSTMLIGPLNVSEFSIIPLAGGFEDAEFDKSSERIAYVDGRLFTHLSSDGTTETIDLPRTSSAVAIAPGGSTAVVGYDAWVSRIDLDTNSLLNNYNVPVNIFDIVASSDDYAHAMPVVGQWVRMQDINLTDGTSTQGGFARHRTKIKLHENSNKIYGTTTDLSPSDIERFDVSSGSTTAAYDSPYHGDFPVCGDLWMGPGGTSVLTDCHVIFRTTESRDTDMNYISRLKTGSRILHADSSAFNNRWYVIEDGDRDTIQIYSANNSSPIGSVDLPNNDNSGSPWIGKFVFASESSGTIYILAQNSENSPTEFALLRRGAASEGNSDVPPSAIAQKYNSAFVTNQIVLDGSQSFDPEGNSLSFNWSLVSEPDGSSVSPAGLTTETVTFTPQVAGVYEFELTVNDGSRDSAPKSVFAYAFASGDSLVHRLEGGLSDMEYSKSQNALVFISDSGNALNILHLDDLSQTRVELDQRPYRVGVSPNGLHAAVSHAGMVSLVDLITGSVTDTQSYAAEWGDIAIDNNQIAHLVPNRDQHVPFYSFDFANDMVHSVRGPYESEIVRVHPTEPWVYTLSTRISPQDLAKWDVTTLPPRELNDPYHGDYSHGRNLWISEEGGKILTQNGNTFFSSSDRSQDMYYAGAIDEDISLIWGDHSTEATAWAVLTNRHSNDAALQNKLVLLDDQFFSYTSDYEISDIPTESGSVNAEGDQVYFSDDGATAYIVSVGSGLLDNYAVQVVDLSTQ